jgi:hypothetical protein
VSSLFIFSRFTSSPIVGVELVQLLGDISR